jgi:deoxycytidine triphosphate deaminase
MTFNSDYVYDKIIDPVNRAKKAQVGVDITVAKIEEILPTRTEDGTPSRILLENNSKLMNVRYSEALTIDSSWMSANGEEKNNVYVLEPNKAYAVTFEQGIKKLEENEWAEIIQRSSLNRAGVRVQGSVFDPGFETDNLGATIYTSQNGINIPKGARIAQILIHENYSTTNPYNGRWQGKANA